MYTWVIPENGDKPRVSDFPVKQCWPYNSEYFRKMQVYRKVHRQQHVEILCI